MQVGFTSIVGTGVSAGIRFYNPVKNNVVDAFKKQEAGVSPACSSTGEHLMYANVCQTLQSKFTKHILRLQSLYTTLISI